MQLIRVPIGGWYFQYFDRAGMQLLQMVAQQLPGPTANITDLLLQKSEDKFFQERVEPLRNYLEWKLQIYFYCLPVASYETQLVGGKEWRPVGGPLALCMLPKFPEVALSRGEQEAKLMPFGGASAVVSAQQAMRQLHDSRET
jgi:hypothetical protein